MDTKHTHGHPHKVYTIKGREVEGAGVNKETNQHKLMITEYMEMQHSQCGTNTSKEGKNCLKKCSKYFF